MAESINKVTHDDDVTRHAEVTAISQAQKTLGTVSLEDCEIYASTEPCALCSYAIRETRIRRVVFGLSSPHMGGASKWNNMAKEAERALIEWNPLIAGIIVKWGLFGSAPRVITIVTRPPGLRGRVLRFLRRHLFDYFGRR